MRGVLFCYKSIGYWAHLVIWTARIRGVHFSSCYTFFFSLFLSLSFCPSSSLFNGGYTGKRKLERKTGQCNLGRCFYNNKRGTASVRLHRPIFYCVLLFPFSFSLFLFRRTIPLKYTFSKCDFKVSLIHDRFIFQRETIFACIRGERSIWHFSRHNYFLSKLTLSIFICFRFLLRITLHLYILFYSLYLYIIFRVFILYRRMPSFIICRRIKILFDKSA